MHPVLIQGTSALSEFRLKQLTESLSTARSDLEDIRIKAESVYILQTNEPLNEASLNQSYRLLSAKTLFKQSDGFFVTPRKATCSPWSSKATDIFQNCGIQGIQRIEKGIYLSLIHISEPTRR